MDASLASPAITEQVGSNQDFIIMETQNTGRNGPSERTLDKPSATVSRNPSQHLGAGGVRLRRLTPRECARLQSVGDSYVFCGPITATYRQIGNGVPPLFAEHLARSVREYLLSERGNIENDNR